MCKEMEGQHSVLFRVKKEGDIYSIPVQYVAQVESLKGKIAAIHRSPDYIVGVYPLAGKNISIIDLRCLLGLEHVTDHDTPGQSVLVVKNSGTEVGFMVETILGVETLHSRQSSGLLFKKFIQNVYLCDHWDGLILELNVPHLLSLCEKSECNQKS